jgi:diguanylate cyclase (GGDEF)-like protein
MSEDPWLERLEGLGRVEAAGDWDAVVSSARRLWDDARAEGRSDVALQAALTGARHLANAGRLEEALPWLQDSAALAESKRLDAACADAWVMLAGIHASRGEAVPAAHAVARVIELLEKAQLGPVQRQRAFNGLSVAYYQFGLNQHSVRMLRESLELSPPVAGDMQGLMRGLNLAMMLLALHDEAAHLPTTDSPDWLGQSEQQLDTFAPLIEAAPGWLHLFAASLRAGALRRRGHSEVAAERLRQALDTWPTAGPPTLHLFVRQELALALGDRGATLSEARSMAQDLLMQTRANSGAATSMFLLENVALLAELAGRHEEANAALRRCLALSRQGVAALVDSQSTGLTRVMEVQAQRLLNADLRERNEALARDVQTISQVAVFDALTGVLNRRGLEAAFERVRGREAFALAMLDVDHFKQINDRHLHVVGDAVLRRLGALLQDALRGPDTVARYGGEEFVLLLAERDMAVARAVAERLRLRIEAEPWFDLAADLAVTVSIGLTAAHPDETLAAVLARADMQLYRAKQKGRNRTEAALLGDGAATGR